jgi:hypothetical protein
VALASCSQIFLVPGLQTNTTTFSLNRGDRVSGSINVTGGFSNDVNFNITDPHGNTVVNLNHVIQSGFSFIAPSTGVYTMIFDNTGGLIQKTVTVDYSVTPSIVGLPQQTFTVLIIITIIIIVFIAIIGWLLLNYSKKERQTAPK